MTGLADQRTQRIALIGYRGAGKSTVARLLAERLGWDWIDADAVLEQRAGCTIRELFAAEGEAGFRSREAALLAELCARPRLVLATGGGVVLRADNRAVLRRSAWVAWLEAGAETLWRRLESDPASAARRPALAVGLAPNAAASNSLAEMIELLKFREPLYRQCADAVVAADGQPPVVADNIERLWRLSTWASNTPPGSCKS